MIYELNDSITIKENIIFKYQIKSYYTKLTGTSKDPNICQYCTESINRATKLNTFS
jgi:hypothetical protein